MKTKGSYLKAYLSFIAVLLVVVLTACTTGNKLSPSVTTNNTPTTGASNTEAVSSASPTGYSATPSVPVSGGFFAVPPGLEKIQHFIFIMQENRSFDHYFGTYPGADGIPEGTALLDPRDGTVVTPYHNPFPFDFDAVHDYQDAIADIDGGKMDGFMKQAYATYALSVKPSEDPGYDPKGVMAYHDYREIPNYWNYALLYTLQDRMFESVQAFSLVSHLYMLAAQSGGYYDSYNQTKPTTFEFPEITQFLHNANISWNYYVTSGLNPDVNGMAIGSEEDQKNAPDKFTLWNPLPAFPAVQNDATQRVHLVDTTQFYADAQSGNLPDVSWVCPNFQNPLSEHPGLKGDLRAGMAYVTGVINAVMKGPQWNSSAIFLSWDDWGGFYDHVVPPQIDNLGYGIRVPGLVISPYAKQNYIDHNTYSFDSWLKIVEERFGLTPMTAREILASDMMNTFDFSQTPRAPLLLSTALEGSPYPQPLQQIGP
jgi:phospholipase C